MLHNEARNLLVQAYEQTHDAKTVAKCFQVSTSTVYRLSGQMKKTGSVDLQTSQRGRKPALTGEDLQDIDQLIIVGAGSPAAFHIYHMLYLASQRIVKHWHARCQNWDMVLSQLELMFADRAVG